MSPLVDEAEIHAPSPTGLARRRALAKAHAVADALLHGPPHAEAGVGDLVVGADQVVFLGATLLGKPADRAHHVRMLRLMRGHWHSLVTAVALLRVGALDPPRLFDVRSRLRVRDDLEDAEIEAYVDSGEGRACAGGYMVEGQGILLFSEIRGDWTNILGLPMIRLLAALRELGAEAPSGIRLGQGRVG
jgi:septum formation protein